MLHNNRKKTTGGYSLLEVLIVLSIIGFLATISLFAITGARKSARDARRISDIKHLKTALFSYLLDYGVVPGRLDAEGLPLSPQYIESSTGNPTDQSQTGVAYCGSGSAWNAVGNNGNLQRLVPNYIGVLARDPLNRPNQNGYCYIYRPNPDLQGACVWTLLERNANNRVGIAVGLQDESLMADGGMPAGYECNFLDEVIGGYDAGLGTGGGGDGGEGDPESGGSGGDSGGSGGDSGGSGDDSGGSGDDSGGSGDPSGSF